ncbi:uncharacterized protein LOC133722446 isoform X2 [Rosa rugosa]|uniref:uncharacterized protein LOC133722446 isoform X2 n=1 Tax=Rosa rugosa TaxID=74645 RepID=UPI002B402820|nr:uncharacterized protein LOC133722446 isoform X2 [Rosa rugosa]
MAAKLGMLHYVLDHVYGAFMHRTKISPQFFSRGWGGKQLELPERMINQLFPEAAGQNWPPILVRPTWKTVWDSKNACLREGVFRTPCDEQLLSALPPESHNARVAFLVPKSVPPQKMACVVHLAGFVPCREQLLLVGAQPEANILRKEDILWLILRRVDSPFMLWLITVLQYS